jgi:DNA-binding Xre family transcriptional regulator
MPFVAWIENKKCAIYVVNSIGDLMGKMNVNSKYFDEFQDYTTKLQSKIRKLRKQKKLTQEDMENFELSLRQFQRIESGETTNVTLSNLFKISKALNISMNKLLE